MPILGSRAAASTQGYGGFLLTGALDPFWNSVSLLCHMDGANAGTTFTDQKSHTVTPASATTSTTQKKFGTTSFFKNGTGSKLSVPNGADFQFGTGSFTIECWIYPTAYGNNLFMYSKNQSGTNFHLFGLSSTGTLFSYVNSVLLSSATVAALNTWHHVAWVRNGTAVNLYLNGTSVASSTNSYNFTETNPVGIGDYTHTNSATGTAYIDDYRITKGVARYTSNFSVPTAAFPNS